MSLAPPPAVPIRREDSPGSARGWKRSPSGARCGGFAGSDRGAGLAIGGDPRPGAVRVSAYLRLLAPQGGHRVDWGGAPGGPPAGQDTDRGRQQRGAAERERIEPGHAIWQRDE